MADSKHVGRHRLGTPGLTHCVLHRPVADALADFPVALLIRTA